jgi:hypothetical protein
MTLIITRHHTASGERRFLAQARKMGVDAAQAA